MSSEWPSNWHVLEIVSWWWCGNTGCCQPGNPGGKHPLYSLANVYCSEEYPLLTALMTNAKALQFSQPTCKGFLPLLISFGCYLSVGPIALTLMRPARYCEPSELPVLIASSIYIKSNKLLLYPHLCCEQMRRGQAALEQEWIPWLVFPYLFFNSVYCTDSLYIIFT